MIVRMWHGRVLSGAVLYRLAGAALASSGILATIGFSVHPHDASGTNHGPWVAAHVVILTGCFLSLLGLAGLYLRSAEPAGWAGLCGFLLVAVSLVLYLGKIYWSGFIYPLVMEHDPEFIRRYGFNPGSDPVDPTVRAVFYAGPLLFALGYGVLGLRLLAARAYPAAALWTVVLGALLLGLWPLLPGVVQHLSVVVSAVYTIGVTWIGVLLATGRAPAQG